MRYTVFFWIDNLNNNTNDNKDIIDKAKKILEILFDNSEIVRNLINEYIDLHKDQIFMKEILDIEGFEPELEIKEILKNKYKTDNIELCYYEPDPLYNLPSLN